MKCIYTKKTEVETSFTSREHIIPAGVGGKQQLPIGYVSDEANNLFSALELDFMRHSLISIPRQFYGPGKRGSLKSCNASESHVCIMFNTKEDDIAYLGYITGGRPKTILQFFIREDGTSSFRCDLEDGYDYENQMSEFIRNIAYYEDKYVYIEEKSLNDNFIFGYHKNKWFFSSSKESNYAQANKYIEALKKNNLKTISNPQEIIGKARVHQSLSFNIFNFERICAKIVFNYLCHLKGPEFVLNSKFDPIRLWMVQGGDNVFSHDFDPSHEHHLTKHLGLAYPDLSHKIIILNDDKYLIGLITFYGNHFTRVIKLCGTTDMEPIYNGLTCPQKVYH